MVRRLGQELGEQLDLPLRDRPPEQMDLFDPGLVERLRQQLQQGLQQQQPGLPLDQPQPANLAEIIARINQSGRSKPPLILRITYNGKERFVEPYSFRYRDKDNPHIPQLMAFSVADGIIKSFKLLTLLAGDVQFTDRSYNPRWPVEF